MQTINGIALSRLFFGEYIKPILAKSFPALPYSAAVTGSGSDILGYDDEVSRDHDWGPKLVIFLPEDKDETCTDLHRVLIENLPRDYQGYDVRIANSTNAPRPLITVTTLRRFLREYLGTGDIDKLSYSDWLAFSEHKLLTIARATFFHDGAGIADRLIPLRYYPDNVWMYLLYSDWSCIAEERAFVKRTSSRGDDVGSRIICARIAHRIIHICFLYERRYAPYPKWFGIAFRELPEYDLLSDVLDDALSASDHIVRENAIARVQSIMIGIHNSSGLTEPVSTDTHPYYTRDITVADSDTVAALISEKLSGTPLAKLPPFGTMSCVGNLVVLTETPENFTGIRTFYDNFI